VPSVIGLTFEQAELSSAKRRAFAVRADRANVDSDRPKGEWSSIRAS
jgi:hypothetical protein